MDKTKLDELMNKKIDSNKLDIYPKYMDKTKQMNREECQKLFNGSYPFDFNDLWSWIETYSNQQREAILRETRDGITNLISNSDGSVDWFNGLRCARGVVDAAIDSVTKIKEEK